MSLVVLGVTGCIAAYKAADVLRGLRRSGCDVVPVMTANACKFITPFTLQNLAGRQAIVDMFSPEGNNYDVKHIPLASEASLLLIAPASANCIGKLANGIADDFLTTLYLATQKPVLLAPAMNTSMYNHPAVQENIKRLIARGDRFCGPVEGILATGHRGMGHLAPPEEIVSMALSILKGKRETLRGRKIVITAGPTQEDLDAIRYITNRSSGKMGYALAAEARARGGEVTLISGPVNLQAPFGVRTLFVKSAADMDREVRAALGGSDIVIMCAAVADFRPRCPHKGKLHKSTWDGRLELERTVDILHEIGQKKEGRYLVGFAAEDGELRSAAESKLKRKNLDLIVANEIGSPDSGMGSDFSNALILSSDGEEEHYSGIRKPELASKIFDVIERKISPRK
jgi:phosphopantothenoylcysteine decarboxylase/phosphopantothenate--cysteine ligase